MTNENVTHVFQVQKLKHKNLEKHKNYWMNCNQKEGNAQKTPTGNRLTSLDSITYTPSHELPVVSLTCYNSRITVQNHTMQLPITQMVRPNLMSHNTKTIQPVASD